MKAEVLRSLAVWLVPENLVRARKAADRHVAEVVFGRGSVVHLLSVSHQFLSLHA